MCHRKEKKMNAESILQVYQLLSNPIIIIVLGIVLILIVREIVLWYWRINKIVFLQQKQIEILESIYEKMNVN
jgi:hypothetical protein